MDTEESETKQYLLQFAELHLFWIYQSSMIHFLGEDGITYVLMDDDDERVARCIKFLLDMNCPTFTQVSEMDSYEERLRNR